MEVDFFSNTYNNSYTVNNNININYKIIFDINNIQLLQIFLVKRTTVIKQYLLELLEFNKHKLYKFNYLA